MMKINKIQKLTILILAMLMIITLATFSVSTPDIALAVESNPNFTRWGGVDVRDEYYYNESNLDLAGLSKVNIDKSKLSLANPFKIAIVDSGLLVDSNNEGLFSELISIDPNTNKWIAYNAVTGESGRDAVKDNTDRNKLGNAALHGTSVAGVVAMQIKALGLQDYIKIVPIKANKFDSQYFYPKEVMHAIDYAANTIKADVINLSLGTLKKSDWMNNKQLQQTINDASETSIVVAAAGNDHTLYDNVLNPDESYPFSPAYYDNVLSVMASGKNGKRHVNSNYGSYDVIAPGEDIWTYTVDKNTNIVGYGRVSGTSMASPLVATFAAVYKARLTALLGKDNVPEPNVIANTIINTYKDQIIETKEINYKVNDSTLTAKHNYYLNYIDFSGLLAKTDYTSGFEYQDPKTMELQVVDSKGFALKTNMETGATYYEGRFIPNSPDKMYINMSIRFTPIGMIHPSKYEKITWYSQDGGKSTVLGVGQHFTFVPDNFGSYLINVVYQDGDVSMYKDIRIKVDPKPYGSEDCEITELKDINKPKSPDEGPDKLNKTLNTKQYGTVKLGIRGLEGVDLSRLEFEWRVDGKIVSTAPTLEFFTKKHGEYKVTCYITDLDTVSGNKTQVIGNVILNVEHFIKEPLAIFSLTAVSLIIVIAVGTVSYIAIKNKKNKKLR